MLKSLSVTIETAVICPRCKREAKGWPLKRAGDRCSPSHWIFCIRNPEDINPPTKEA